MSLVKNYQTDLKKSTITPLLIELSKKDLNRLCSDDICGINIAIDRARAIYDGVEELKNSTQSNLIYIDANKVKNVEHVFLLEVLLDILKDSIKNIKNLEVAKQGISSALSFATGGILNAEIGGFINDAVSSVVHNISEEVSGFLVDGILSYEDISEQINNLIEEKTFDFISDTSTNLIDKVTQNNLYLTDASKKAIEELSKQFKEELSPAESFRFILKLMVSLALEMPKILFIKDPHKLDKDSLAILSLLYSFSKDAKDLGKHTGLSIVYAYDDENFQPYQEVDKKYKLSKQLLDEQRLFAQRYAILERPTSDIPHIAVKSSVFVGREEELKKLNERYFYSKEHKDINTLEVISAEPGIGKTKLVKKHFHQIRLQEKFGDYQIQLSLLNQVGHTSTNTGLSSLINSIVQEANRLENCKTLTKKYTENIAEYAVDTVYTSIKSILGVDTLIDISEAIGDRVFLDGQLSKTKLNTIGDLDNKLQEKKQEQFLKLNQSIVELQTFADKNIPIVLFIDDLQWIDDDSAEYILQHFINKFNVHMVSTMRPSDATTALKIAYESKELNTHKIALLEKVGIHFVDTKKNEIENIQVDTLHLSGLNTNTLRLLIEQVIQSDTKNSEILANTIIKKLNNDETKDEVNTLFGVETINMLCDKKLYENQDIEQLILTDTPLRFNPDINDFQKALEDTFTLLLKKYEKSLSHYHDTTEESEQKFNLMAYAVLEERLNILKIYFAEHGNAVVNTLLFSSLLGSPFNSSIVKNVLEAIAITDEELLQSLKEYILNGEEKITLTEMHYEIIEEVYEILSRYTVFENSYEYRHSLLNVFLERQLEYQLDKVFIINKMESKDKLYELILKEISLEEKQQKFYGENEQNLNTKTYESLFFYKISEHNILKKAFKNNSIWLINYINSLNNLALSYNNKNNFDNSVQMLKECLSVLKKSYDGSTILTELYIRTLNNLALPYKRNYNIKKAIKLEEESLYICEDLYNHNHNHWVLLYTGALNNLAMSYKQINKKDEALLLEKKLLNIIKPLFVQKPDLWSKDYLGSLGNLAISYKNKNNLKKALLLENEILTIIEELYNKDKKNWLLEYTRILKNLAETYYKLDNIKQAIYLSERSLKLRKKLYQNNSEFWAEYYFGSINDLSIYYRSANNLDEAIELIKKILYSLEILYHKNKIFWGPIYRKLLNSQSETYFMLKDFDNSIILETRGLKVVENLYNNNPDMWSIDYAISLNNIVKSYGNSNQINQAMIFGKESLSIIEKLYKHDTHKWLTIYITALDNLAIAYYNQHYFENSLLLFKVEYKILITNFGKNHQDAKAVLEKIEIINNIIKN